MDAVGERVVGHDEVAGAGGRLVVATLGGATHEESRYPVLRLPPGGG